METPALTPAPHAADGGSGSEIPREEERLLARVQESLAARLAEAQRAQRTSPASAASGRSDAELVSLRDEIAEARLEDVAALVAQMERLQGVSLSRTEARAVLVDPAAPYFGHLRLVEHTPRGGSVERDVFIGRATYVDPQRRVNIVDWRHAPVSQLYYRYEEGSDYDERFGDRQAEGEIAARRTLTIEGGVLVRVACPQGVWTRDAAGAWQRADEVAHDLAGGEGAAVRVSARPTLGAAGRDGRVQRVDRRLPEIAALIDPHQFDVITDRRAGVVVVQGGAGSGKTTIGLHRIAFLAQHGKNPRAMLVVTYGAALAAYMSQVLPALGVHGVPVMTFEGWATRELRRAVPWLAAAIVDDAPPAVTRVKSHPALLAELERRAAAHVAAGKPRTSRAVVELWGDLLTDRKALVGSEADLADARPVLAERVAAVLERDFAEERRRAREPLPADEDIRGDVGIDGVRTDGEPPLLDLPDVAILLRAHQIVRGGGKRRLAHLFIDEAQDLSPVELSALIGQTAAVGGQRSVTLAGDTAQRLFLDNGFRDWRSVLEELGLAHVAIEPLRIAYRSTREILALARHVMGPLYDGDPPVAPRSGAPVEALRFPGAGAAVAFLAEALRRLAASEPRATVAVLARHPEQADRYYEGLRRAEVPALRRVRAQEFTFRPGTEVTEIRQAKGLEFDYVIICDVNAGTFGTDDESRHLLHIAATRAAHQLWLVVTAPPSPLIPADALSA